MDSTTPFQAMARNNAWSNARLLGACKALDREAFAAERTGFFPSLQLTLNHILLVDRFYLDGLEEGGLGRSVYGEEVPFPLAADLAEAQAAEDRRLVAFCDGLSAADLARHVGLDRGPDGILQERIGDILLHLFLHQVHHRGQAHAMLSSTDVAPPQLDEFFLAGDLPLRRAEVEALDLQP